MSGTVATGDELVKLVDEWQRLTARVIDAVGEFDASGLYELDGHRSVSRWLVTHTGVADSTARFWRRMARLLRHVPALAAALSEQRLSLAQLDLIAGHVDSVVMPVLVEQQDDLVEILATLDIEATTAVMREWRQRADALMCRPEPAQRPSTLMHLPIFDDSFMTQGRFNTDDGSIIATALRAAMTDDPDLALEHKRTYSERMADALTDICSAFLSTITDDKITARGRPHLNVVINLDDLPTGRHAVHLDSGLPLSKPEIHRLLCDAALHRVIIDGDSNILDYGRSTRTVTGALWHALQLRDRHCRFPNCDRPAYWCDAHHVHAWESGGHTNLTNLVLLCRRHHRLLHTQGWHHKLLPDATLEIVNPQGLPRTSEPPGLRKPMLA